MDTIIVGISDLWHGLDRHFSATGFKSKTNYFKSKIVECSHEIQRNLVF